jgi:hypothetical protein
LLVVVRSFWGPTRVPRFVIPKQKYMQVFQWQIYPSVIVVVVVDLCGMYFLVILFDFVVGHNAYGCGEGDDDDP